MFEIKETSYTINDALCFVIELNDEVLPFVYETKQDAIDAAELLEFGG